MCERENVVFCVVKNSENKNCNRAGEKEYEVHDQSKRKEYRKDHH